MPFAATPVTVASYLPESLLIRIGPDLQLFAESVDEHQPPTAAALGFFFHEYCRYLHNLSTLSGIACFINTIEFWSTFRLTFRADGWSSGSGNLLQAQRERLERLSRYLTGTRRTTQPHLNIAGPARELIFLDLATEQVVAGPEGNLLSAMVGDAEVRNEQGQMQKARIELGTLELLEGAAWLLEGLFVRRIDPSNNLLEPPIFPYRVFEAAAAFRVSGLEPRDIAACILAALQSSDEIDAVFEAARQARAAGRSVFDALAAMVRQSLKVCKQDLNTWFDDLEQKFGGNGIFAVGIRYVIATARRAFERRIEDPFFEFLIIESVVDGTEAFRRAIRLTAPCAVLYTPARIAMLTSCAICVPLGRKSNAACTTRSRSSGSTSVVLT
jgi:hypothetical protein